MNTENARSALREVLVTDIWSAHYRRLCESGVGKIDAESGRYVTVLRAQGVEATLDEVRAALRSLAVLLHPASPAAQAIALEGDGNEPHAEVTGNAGNASNAGNHGVPDTDDELDVSAYSARLRVRQTTYPLDIVEWTAEMYAVEALACRPDLLRELQRSSRTADPDALLAVTRNIYRPARILGMRSEPEHFSDHVFRIRAELFPCSLGAQDGGWLDDLDDQAVAYLTDHGLLDSLDPDVMFAHAKTALRCVCAGDRRGARDAYRELVKTAVLAARSSA